MHHLQPVASNTVPTDALVRNSQIVPQVSKTKIKIQRKSLPLSQPTTNPFIRVHSERPFVVKIKTKGIPRNSGGISAARAVVPKRKRPTYRELKDTDSEDFMDTEEEEEVVEKKKSRTKSKSPNIGNEDLASLGMSHSNGDVVSAIPTNRADHQVDAPPPGVLANLWYSREEVLHLWVIEKVIGWKTRPVVSLTWTNPNDLKCLDDVEAQTITSKALVHEALWKVPAKRMEISRINSGQCPMVLHLAAQKEMVAAEQERREPRYRITATPVNSSQKTEEVLLVKWRGRSYMHTSWERKKDLEKFDHSNNTARGKIRRYIQAQEVAYGKDWKQVLSMGSAPTEDDGQTGAEDELFPPQFLEVERLLACDESEMNMAMFAKQRALNIREEERMLKQLEKEEAEGMVHLHKTGIFEDLPLLSDGEDPWDPEDYVRYVVKWKGLQYAEMTWEYWINIKRDAVTQAEDFWLRQQAPDPEDIRKLPGHPHMRDFRKLTESPAFGISKVPRPVADLGDGFKADDEDEKEEREFKLRSYQLEGVNWLLFNWWNKRSCIL